MLAKEELEKTLAIAERQIALNRIEQVSTESALEELEKIRKSKGIDESFYKGMHKDYSQRLNEATEIINKNKGIVRSMKQFNKYQKELKDIKQLQAELSTKIEKIDNKLLEEGNKLLDAVRSVDLLKEELSKETDIPTDLTSETELIKPEEPRVDLIEVDTGRETASMDETQSDVESLKKEILSELEKIKREK